MAAVAASNITNITRSIAAGLGTGLNLAGAPVAAYRIASGQVNADTIALVVSPEFGTIRSVLGPVGHNLPTTGVGATSVTATIIGPTTTIPAFDVYLVGSPAPN